jgi:Arc/MetJ-type ribon-helix-helix transcriptional regulator
MKTGKRGRPRLFDQYVKFSVNIGIEDVQVIDKLITDGVFPTRSEAIRYAIQYAFSQFYPEDIKTIPGRRVSIRAGRPPKTLQRKT